MCNYFQIHKGGRGGQSPPSSPLFLPWFRDRTYAPCPLFARTAFDGYAKSQLTFAKTVAELADNPSNAEHMYKRHVVGSVLPLITNDNTTVRANAVLVLSRLAGYSEQCARQMLCSHNLLKDLLGQVSKENVGTVT